MPLSDQGNPVVKATDDETDPHETPYKRPYSSETDRRTTPVPVVTQDRSPHEQYRDEETGRQLVQLIPRDSLTTLSE